MRDKYQVHTPARAPLSSTAMRARRAHLLSPLAVLCATYVQAADEIPVCSPMPSVLRISQPLYPPNVETRGLPSPVSVVVEFTLSPDGHASGAKVIESEAGSYAREFGELAIDAVATWQFHHTANTCRGRAKVVFKIAPDAHA